MKLHPKTQYKTKKSFVKSSALVCATLFISGCGIELPNKNQENVDTYPALSAEGVTLPKPPTGYEWQMLEMLSDDFNGDQLNTNKWRDHITTWRGRPPAEFLPKNVSVKDGTLQLRTSTHSSPTEQYTMGGSAVSGKVAQTYGYFEARIKASKVKTSTTFWLHSDSHDDKALGCGKSHGTEIDILEMIGGWPESSWTNVMRSNTHYKPTESKDGRCQGAKYVSKGYKHDAQIDLSEDFHTYGAWWVTPNQVHFYFDGERVGSVNLEHEVDRVPFNSEMSLRMVVETYDWQPQWIPEGQAPYPNARELDDSSINTAFYDYVKSFKLVPSKSNLIKNGDFESSIGNTWQLSTQGVYRSNDRAFSYTHDYGLVISKNGSAKQTIKVKAGQTYLLNIIGKILAQDEQNVEIRNGLTVSIIDNNGQTLTSTQIKEDTFNDHQLVFSATTETITVVLTSKGGAVSVVDNIALLAQSN